MKKILFSVSIMLMIVAGCNVEEPYICGCDTSFLSYNDSLMETFKGNTFLNGWRKNSYQMDPLIENNHETYRILMIYSLSHYSHVYTVENGKNGKRIIVHQFVAPKIDKRNNKLDKDLIVNLTDQEWRDIKRTIEEKCFWSEPLGKEPQERLDGGNWFVEGYDPAKRNCANGSFHIDVCSYGEKNKLGDIVRKIISYVDQTKLNDVL